MYKKIIQSGNQIEVYEYDKELPEYRRHKKKPGYKNPRRYTRSVQRARSSFLRLARANLGGTAKPVFLTLTMHKIVTIKEGWKAFSRFGAKLRRQAKGRVSYISVPEFQKRGAVHFHCLVFGLTHEEISQERVTRRIAKLWGYGFVDVLTTDGHPKIAGYMAKYMSKAMFDDRLSGQKAYSASRSLVRPSTFSTGTSVYYIEQELAGGRIQGNGDIIEGVDKPLVPVFEKEYDTKWLGRCRYKMFNLGT